MNRNVKLYYAHEILVNGLLFSTPIIVLYLTQYISIAEVILLSSIQFAIVALLELPTGVIADLFGRRYSLIFGSALYFLGWLVFLPSKQFNHFAIAYALFGFGEAFITGVAESILYDSLKKEKKEDQAVLYFGKGIFYPSRFSQATLAIGGLIAKISYGAVFIIELIKWPFVAVIALFMREPYTPKRQNSIRYYVNELSSSVNFSLRTPKLAFLIFVGAFIYALFFVSSQYDQLLLKTSGIDVAIFGFVYAFLYSLNGYAARYAHKLEKRVQPKYFFRLVLILYASALIFLALFSNPVIVVLLLSTKMISKGFETPVLLGYMNKLIPSKKRSTILSFYKLVQSLALVFVSAVFTVFTNTYDVRGALVIAGVLLGLFVLVADPSRNLNL